MGMATLKIYGLVECRKKSEIYRFLNCFIDGDIRLNVGWEWVFALGFSVHYSNLGICYDQCYS